MSLMHWEYECHGVPLKRVSLVTWRDPTQMKGRKVDLDNKRLDKESRPKYPVDWLRDFSRSTILHPAVGTKVDKYGRAPVDAAIIRLLNMWEEAGAAQVRHEHSLAGHRPDPDSLDVCIFCKRSIDNTPEHRCPLCLLTWHDACSAAAERCLGPTVGALPLPIIDIPAEFHFGMCALCKSWAATAS